MRGRTTAHLLPRLFGEEKDMTESIKTGLVARMKQVGAFDVRIADPAKGFDKMPPNVRPLSLWPECKSVVVFAVAMSPGCNNIYLGTRAPGEAFRDVGPVPVDIQCNDFAMDRLSRLFVASITHKGMLYLANHGCGVSFKSPPLKMSAYESGIGVYGRSGLILHPVLGNRMSLGAILTNVRMEPDPKMDGYEPCEDCRRCMEMCPAKAFDPEKSYPESWSRERCTRKRSEIAAKGYYCHNCFAVCPAGKVKDEDLFSIRNAVNFSKQHRFYLHIGTEPINSGDAKKPRP